MRAVLPLLQGNLRINRFEGRAEVRTEALSDRQGEADLYLPVDDHGLVETSSSLEREFRATHDGAVTVPVTTLDAALLHSPPLAVLKIDVEGHEAAVLSGAGAMIEEHRPVVALELLSGADFAGVNALLSHSRYRAVRLRTDAAVREEVVEYDPLAWNHMLVPEEKWSEFEALLRACRLTS
jgi:FkbM family methyltransferase